MYRVIILKKLGYIWAYFFFREKMESRALVQNQNILSSHWYGRTKWWLLSAAIHTSSSIFTFKSALLNESYICFQLWEYMFQCVLRPDLKTYLSEDIGMKNRSFLYYMIRKNTRIREVFCLLQKHYYSIQHWNIFATSEYNIQQNFAHALPNFGNDHFGTFWTRISFTVPILSLYVIVSIFISAILTIMTLQSSARKTPHLSTSKIKNTSDLFEQRWVLQLLGTGDIILLTPKF